MNSHTQTTVNRTGTMLVYVGGFLRHGRVHVDLLFLWPQQWVFEKRSDFIKYRRIASDGNVEGRHKRQPQQIIRKPCPYTTSTWWMPPVLDIAFLKLMLTREYDLTTCHLATAVDQGHHVLQLIAETKRTTRLVERGAGPDSTRECLVEEPPIEHRVQRLVRCFDLDGAKQVIPMCKYLLECRINCPRVSVYCQ